ncbi:MAG: adenylosuccinate synthase [Anaerotignum sp.]
MLTSIVGINWGDEGKGRMVDLLSQEFDIVCRYQGGNNAGHTVINDLGKFVLNLLPSGILREDIVNIMGNGMVIDLEHLYHEVERLNHAGVKITSKNLKISDKAIICLPYHKHLDCLEEDRLGDAKYGSTRRGISPAYGDKYMKKCLRMGDLLHPDSYPETLKNLVAYKNLTIEGVYDAPPVQYEEILQWLETFGTPFKENIIDTGLYLNEAEKSGKKIMFEAQLGALRDIDFGIYPYTSSSSTIAAYAPIGAGVPNLQLHNVIGIMKAYSSCVGEGPFTCELFGKEADDLRDAGGEYGAATGRPRRVGPFDVVASRYGIRIQGCNEIALTKMDVLSYLDEIPICTKYKINGEEITEFPYSALLDHAEPVIETMKGWRCDISHCRTIEDLPKEALAYIKYLEEVVGCAIKYVSVGAERDAYITMY